MAEGVVTSGPEAIEAINTMKSTINGGLIEAITALVTAGDRLSPTNFDGPLASQFYEEWPTTKQTLRDAKDRLDMMSDDIMRVNTNIQSAGGNG